MSYTIGSAAVLTLMALLMTVADDLVDTSSWHPLAISGGSDPAAVAAAAGAGASAGSGAAGAGAGVSASDVARSTAA